MAASDVNTAAAAAVAAIEAADWATAESKLLVAMAYLAALPDSVLGAGSGSSELTYDRNAIDRLLSHVRAARAAAAVNEAGILRSSKIIYQRESDDD